MIKGLAEAARAFHNPDWQSSAERAVRFIREHMWRDGRLLATSKDGHAHLSAYLDDYVFLIDALLELLQLRWNSADLQFALQLAEVVLEHFAATDGGFYFTADDHETLIQRPRPWNDDALPAGNAIAARVFGRLGHLLGDSRYLDACELTLRASWEHLQQSPYGHTGLLLALEEYLQPVEIIVIRGNSRLSAWQQAANQGFQPRRMVFAIPDQATELPGLLAERRPMGEGVAYLCQGFQCQPPVLTLDSLQLEMNASVRGE
jgi:uncharacterized protein YyaL (SSP411 family)